MQLHFSSSYYRLQTNGVKRISHAVIDSMDISFSWVLFSTQNQAYILWTIYSFIVQIFIIFRIVFGPLIRLHSSMNTKRSSKQQNLRNIWLYFEASPLSIQMLRHYTHQLRTGRYIITVLFADDRVIIALHWAVIFFTKSCPRAPFNS